MDYYGIDIALDNNGEIKLNNNDFALVSGINNILQSIRLRFITPRGSLFYDDNYGSELYKYIHCQNNYVIYKKIKKEIENTLKDEPLVDNESISIILNYNNKQGYIADIEFKLLNYDTKYNLVIQINKEIKIWSNWYGFL